MKTQMTKKEFIKKIEKARKSRKVKITASLVPFLIITVILLFP